MLDGDYLYEIVDACPSDEIVKLYRAGGWWREHYSEKLIPAMIRGSFCFLTVRHKGVLIGMGRVISDGVSDAYIQDVIVLKEFRGKGIGAQIIPRLVAFCQNKRLEWIALIAEPGTAPFYEKLGFKPLKNDIPMKWGT